MGALTSPDAAPRVRRLDASLAVDRLLRATGVRLVVEGPCRGGQVGAAYVRWEDGRRSVLTWRPGTALAAMRAGPIAVVDALRADGFPCPAVELSAQVGPDVVLVQELLPGGPVGTFGHAALDRALALSGAMAGRLAGRGDVEPVRLHLRGDGPGFCLHGPLRSHGPRGAALERRIRAVTPDPEPRWDAVHFDFHPGNMLAAVTGASTSSPCGSASKSTTRSPVSSSGSTPCSTRWSPTSSGLCGRT
ncbi:phosphotransferase [Streptomyces montanisoli]|uniref:phosphotransferase n=1 Tax=Streptomyces montanisoli TaxID=2798581 RepID=UPI0027DDE3F8|nr:phosphotransferase [Streptomyces montanisoli]